MSHPATLLCVPACSEELGRVISFYNVLMCILQRNETIESEAFEKGLAKGKAEATADQEEKNTQSNTADEVRNLIIFSQICVDAGLHLLFLGPMV